MDQPTQHIVLRTIPCPQCGAPIIERRKPHTRSARSYACLCFPGYRPTPEEPDADPTK